MRKLLVLVVLLSGAGVGRAGEKEIIEGLKVAGVNVVGLGPGGGLAVSLDGSTLDTALSELCELRSLRCLILHHSGLTDNQVQQICALPGLKELSFRNCLVTDARLKIVARVRGLESLGLDDAAITDAGLAEVARLRDLKVLILGGTAFTDAGLRHLEGMKELQVLLVGNCPKVTPEGVAHLQKALPDCKIYR
jgi:hypothetical protein